MNSRFEQQPWATILILTLIALAFVCEVLVSPGPKNLAVLEPNFDSLVSLGGSAFELSVTKGEWWRFLSVMLLHGGATHVGLNALNAWFLSTTLERRAGWREVLAAFVFTGVVAAVTSAFVSREALSVGASGAIFGTLGFLVMLGVRHLAQAGEQLRRNVGPLVLAVGTSAIIPNVDNSAHVGGLLAGLLLGFVWERLPRAAHTALGALGMLACCLDSGRFVRARCALVGNDCGGHKTQRSPAKAGLLERLIFTCFAGSRGPLCWWLGLASGRSRPCLW